MTIDELREWQAFDSIDPIGGYRGDLQAAMLAMMQSGNKDAKIADFLVVDPHPMTTEQRVIHQQRQDQYRHEAYTQHLIATFQSRVKRN